MLPIKKILCPTDFSEPSYAGVEAARELAVHFSAELVLIHVVPPPYAVGAPGVPPGYKIEEYTEEMHRYASDNLEKTADNKIASDVKTKRVVAEGHAADEIVDSAEKEGADVIVIATHGWSGWRRLLFGSIAEKVVRLASCPVVTIPEPRNQ